MLCFESFDKWFRVVRFSQIGVSSRDLSSFLLLMPHGVSLSNQNRWNRKPKPFYDDVLKSHYLLLDGNSIWRDLYGVCSVGCHKV